MRLAGRRRARDLRDHGRPGPQDDVPGAVPAGEARAALVSCGRRRDGRPVDDDLRHRAHEAIAALGTGIDEGVFAAFAERLRYVRGDFGEADTYGRVAAAIKGASHPVFYLEIPPLLFGTVVKGLAEAGLTANARVVVEKPFGHDLDSARALNADLSADRRVAAVPDRPLPGEDVGRGHPLPALRQHGAGAGVEPPLRRRCRSRWPRTSASPTAAASTTRSARCATSSRTTSCRCCAGRDGAARRPRRRRVGNRKRDVFAAMPAADPAHYGAASTTGYLDRRRRCRLDDRDYWRCAGGRQLALVGSAVLHPGG